MSGERTRPRHRGLYLAGANRVFSACFQGTIEFLDDPPGENETPPAALDKQPREVIRETADTIVVGARSCRVPGLAGF
jgi:hypothetical protein